MIVSVEVCAEVRVDQEEKEEWAKPLTALWQSRPYDPQAERDYNKSMGQQAPYCSICQLFHTHHQVTSLTHCFSAKCCLVLILKFFFQLLCSLCHHHSCQNFTNNKQPSQQML